MDKDNRKVASKTTYKHIISKDINDSAAYVAGLIDGKGFFTFRQGTPLYIYGSTTFETTKFLSQYFDIPLYKSQRLTSGGRVYYQVTLTPTSLRVLAQNPFLIIKRNQLQSINKIVLQQQPQRSTFYFCPKVFCGDENWTDEYLAAVIDSCGSLSVEDNGNLKSLVLQSKDAQFLFLLYNVLLSKGISSRICGKRLFLGKKATLKLLNLVKSRLLARKDIAELLCRINEWGKLYDITHIDKVKLDILRKRNIGFLQ